MWYIANGTVRYIDDKVLMHYGVKGMKWGKRKAPMASLSNGLRRRKNNTNPNDAEAKQARKQKVKKAVKIGAAVAATALAAYGAKKLHDVVRDKNLSSHIEKGQKYANNVTRRLYSRNDMYREFARESKESFRKYYPEIQRNERRIADIISGEVDKAYERARSDTFGAALKNVVKDEIAKRRR